MTFWIVDNVCKFFFLIIHGYERILKLSEKRWNPFPEDTYIDMSVTIIILNRGEGIRESTIFYVGRNINNQATVGLTWSNNWH